MAELLELKPAAAPATVLESEDTGRERRARGFDIGASRRGLLRKKEGHGWPRMAACELVGSSARATIGIDAAWER